jgi:hypothetical protein
MAAIFGPCDRKRLTASFAVCNDMREVFGFLACP